MQVLVKHGKVVKVEGLKALEERMHALNPNIDDTYRFLGIEQAEGIKLRKFC